MQTQQGIQIGPSGGQYIAVACVHSIISAVSDRRFRESLNGSVMATPDGMPIVWALRSLGKKDQQRVYGPSLMLSLCEMAAQQGFRVFLYGSRVETLDKLEQNLLRKIPNLQIAGTLSPPFRPLSQAESASIVERIAKSEADLVFVGLGCPKQEHWMAEHASLLPKSILIGVGAAFDFHAGTLHQAPSWMQTRGLEWLFRFLVEPRRLWKRYLVVSPLFLPLWGLQKLGLLRFFVSPYSPQRTAAR